MTGALISIKPLDDKEAWKDVYAVFQITMFYALDCQASELSVVTGSCSLFLIITAAEVILHDNILLLSPRDFLSLLN